MHLLKTLSCVLIFTPKFHAVLARSSVNIRRTTTIAQSFGVPGVNATYDYVVVGGGTAGLTIASRLAAEPSISVAVIEAGGFYEAEDGNISVVPGYCTVYAGTDPADTNPLVDWGFVTLPQAVSILIDTDYDTKRIPNDSIGCQQSSIALCSREDPRRFFSKEFSILP